VSSIDRGSAIQSSDAEPTAVTAPRRVGRPPAGARWRPAPLLQASAALHCAALGLTAWRPHWWPWTLAAVAANHLQLVGAGLSPRSQLLGSNWTRLPAGAAASGQVAITLDDGPDPEVTPRVLELLRAHAVRATFFCIGERARRYPALVRACAAAGHGIENHTDSHSAAFSLMRSRRLRLEIERAQYTLAELSGQAPRFFRAPAGLRSPLLDPLLQRLGLQLTAWTRRGFDTVSCDYAKVLQRLTRQLAAGDILLLHDGHAARSPGGMPVVLEVLPALLDQLQARRLRPVRLDEALACPA
jgi:peptidoglycan/xylan/chitin deacetylase (PgdA/CDA1 family)